MDYAIVISGIATIDPLSLLIQRQAMARFEYPPLWASLFVIAFVVLAMGGCGAERTEETSAPINAEPKRSATVESNDAEATVEPLSSAAPLQFAEQAESAGLNFVHRSGAAGQFTYPEIMSGGVCVADLDGDGDLDVYLPQGGPIPGDSGEPGRNVLFLNDGSGHFTNASAGSGADDRSYAMGAFAADLDADGDNDLIVTNAGSLVVLRNLGAAKFEDITREAGFADREGLWLNVAVTDLNADGHVDVYCSNYTRWEAGNDPECSAPGGGPDYCNPTSYPGAVDFLCLGNGDGTFTDVSESSGIASAKTRSMGVVVFDADADGDPDLYVANDGEANLLWINQGNGTFKDEAMVPRSCSEQRGRPGSQHGSRLRRRRPGRRRRPADDPHEPRNKYPVSKR